MSAHANGQATGFDLNFSQSAANKKPLETLRGSKGFLVTRMGFEPMGASVKGW